MTVRGPADRPPNAPTPARHPPGGLSLAHGPIAAYNHPVRTSPGHRLLAAFMALWLPFCCCQARAAARTLVHAVHGGDAAAACGDDALPPCCRAAQEPAEGCCGDGTGPSDRSPAEPAPCSDCAACGVLKAKATAPEAPAIEHDSIGVADAALLAVPAPEAPSARADAASWPRANAPPWKPGGRAALALHATLVI